MFVRDDPGVGVRLDPVKEFVDHLARADWVCDTRVADGDVDGAVRRASQRAFAESRNCGEAHWV